MNVMLSLSKHWAKSNSGVSLIIAILFVSAFLFVMAGLYEAQSKVYSSLANRENEAKAFYLAESAGELASYWAATNGVGASTPSGPGGGGGGAGGVGSDGGGSGGDATRSGPGADTERSATDTGVGTDPAFVSFSNSFLTPLFDAAEALGIQNCSDPDGDPSTADACVGFQVLGRTSSDSTQSQLQIGGVGPAYYSVPVALAEGGVVHGTGDASEHCGANAGDANDPCHWNKLYAGESVEIPLYYEAPNAAGVLEPHAVDLSSGNQFKLRIRAPCDTEGFVEPIGGCAESERIVLYPVPNSDSRSPTSPPNPYRDPDSDKDPVLIQWLIADADGASTLLARDVLPSGGLRPPPSSPSNAGNNTELSGGRINASNPAVSVVPRALNYFVVLEKDHYGDNLDRDRVRVYCFIDPSIVGCEPAPTPPKPILRLNLVGQPRREDIGVDSPLNNTDRQFTSAQLNSSIYNVPFLEYQLLLSDSAFSDNKSELITWINIGNFRKELRLTKKRATSLGTFALESF